MPPAPVSKYESGYRTPEMSRPCEACGVEMPLVDVQLLPEGAASFDALLRYVCPTHGPASYTSEVWYDGTTCVRCKRWAPVIDFISVDIGVSTMKGHYTWECLMCGSFCSVDEWAGTGRYKHVRRWVYFDLRVTVLQPCRYAFPIAEDAHKRQSPITHRKELEESFVADGTAMAHAIEMRARSRA